MRMPAQGKLLGFSKGFWFFWPAAPVVAHCAALAQLQTWGRGREYPPWVFTDSLVPRLPRLVWRSAAVVPCSLV